MTKPAIEHQADEQSSELRDKALNPHPNFVPSVPVLPTFYGSRAAESLLKARQKPDSEAWAAFQWLWRRFGTLSHVALALDVPVQTVGGWSSGRFSMGAAERSLVVLTARLHGWVRPQDRKPVEQKAQAA